MNLVSFAGLGFGIFLIIVGLLGGFVSIYGSALAVGGATTSDEESAIAARCLFFCLISAAFLASGMALTILTLKAA